MNRIIYVEIDEGHQVACSCAPELAIHVGDQCVIEVDKVLEFGKIAKIVEAADAAAAADKRTAHVLRRATLHDHAKANEDAIMSRIAMTTLAAKVEKMALDMRVVRVRYSFDRTVLRVTFTAEDRIEYGALLQELGTELRARIEMNQIGVRNEAGMIGGMGPCGRRLCCCSWLHQFESVNVRMAKAQRVSLNPAAISGMCSRLKCCLRYEFETYRELGRNMPHEGAVVESPDGRGQVIENDILSQRVKVRLDDERVLDYGINEIRVDQHSKKQRREEDEDSGAEWTESEPAGKA